MPLLKNLQGRRVRKYLVLEKIGDGWMCELFCFVLFCLYLPFSVKSNRPVRSPPRASIQSTVMITVLSLDFFWLFLLRFSGFFSAYLGLLAIF